jgi:hypothetical protein
MKLVEVTTEGGSLPREYGWRFQDMIAPIESKCSEHNFDYFLNGMSLSSGDDKILRLVQAEDAMHGVDIIGRVSPIDPGREVAEVEFLRGTA